MEYQEVIKAVHEVELHLNKSIAKVTTALEVNNERLQNLKESVDNHGTILYGAEENDHPGLTTRMAKIEQTETERKWTLRSVLVAFIGVVSKVAYDFFNY